MACGLLEIGSHFVPTNVRCWLLREAVISTPVPVGARKSQHLVKEGILCPPWTLHFGKDVMGPLD